MDARKDNARAQLRKAVRCGRVTKPTACSRCGRTDRRIDGHHANGYDDPYDVEWLCQLCHSREHPENARAGRRAIPREAMVKGGRLGGQQHADKQRAKTHCPQGHPYDEANTRVRPNGWRACRACNREQQKRRGSDE